MKNMFHAADVAEVLARIDRLKPTTTALWGKMTVDQMLAHVNVAYEMVYENKHPKPSWLIAVALKLFVKQKVVGPAPYPRNSPTAPAFVIKERKDFAVEKGRLMDFINRVQREGESSFAGRPSPSFGPLTTSEWNVLFYKHLDHHLLQFGE